MYNKAASIYQKAQVTTASRGHLVVMLYEGAVKSLNEAIDLFDSSDNIKTRDIEKFSHAIQKTQSIINELQVSLNMEAGGDIAKNLMALYVYFNNELLDANIKHDKKKIIAVRDMLSDMTGAWRTVSETSANTTKTQGVTTLNTEG